MCQPVYPLQSAHPTTLMGCCSHCWLFVALFPALWTINQHLFLCLCSGDVLPKGRRLNSPLWVSFLLLSDSYISGHGPSEFCSSPLERLRPFRAWSHHTFHKHVLDPSSKPSSKTLARPRSEANLCRFGSEPSLTTLHGVFQPLVPFPP